MQKPNVTFTLEIVCLRLNSLQSIHDLPALCVATATDVIIGDCFCLILLLEIIYSHYCEAQLSFVMISSLSLQGSLVRNKAQGWNRRHAVCVQAIG